MVKKNGKKGDPEKTAALAARKEAKAEKAARKRLSKDGKQEYEEEVDDDDDDDVDRLIELYKQQDMKGPCKIIDVDGFPLARANATLTLAADTKKKEAYLFGGEYFDGANNVVSNQLFKFEASTTKWKQLVSKDSPPPRCAHSCVYFNRHLYVFGGECATDSSDYIHYKDLWKFNTSTLLWTEVRFASSADRMPSPRSGHAATVWKHFMIVFGGFFETSDQSPRWYNDVKVLNLQTEQWLDIPHSQLSLRPEARSACNAAPVGDQWIIHGGFTKNLKRQPSAEAETTLLPAPEAKVHTDAWTLHLKPLLSGKPPTWERLTSSLPIVKQTEAASISANGRSGVGSLEYNNHMLLFGGVVDQEMHHHVVKSVFYNDLGLFHLEKRKFIRIQTRNADDKPTDDDKIADDSEVDDVKAKHVAGWDLEKLRSNMFGFIDGQGNMVYEKLDEEKEETKAEKKELKLDKIVLRTEPLPRIKPCMFLIGSTLYIYGGLLEVGDREVTLDDMWCIDLKKKRCWECVYPGTMHRQVWRGALYDDDDSYVSSNKGDDEEENDDEDDGETKEEKEETKKEEDEAKEEPKPKSSSSIRKEIDELVERYQLDNDNKTPQPEESFDDFYTRTAAYWKAKDEDALASARARFEELEPVIERVKELILQRQEMKERKKTK